MKSNIVYQLHRHFLPHFFICQYLPFIFDWDGARHYALLLTAFGQYSPKPLTGFLTTLVWTHAQLENLYEKN